MEKQCPCAAHISACVPAGWQCSPRLFLVDFDFLECKWTEQCAGKKNSSRYPTQSYPWDHHMLYQKRPGGLESQVSASGSVVEKEK